MAGKKPPLWAVIMAGGIGARFWPASRRERPKQFLPPGGGHPDGVQAKREMGRDTLLRRTANRLQGLVPSERILVIASCGHRRLIRESLPELPVRNVILEPDGRNTAPCLGLAAHLIEAREPGALMAAFPADHHISRPTSLRRLVRTGARIAAERDAIVTLGMKPTGPETGYGYIQRGKAVPAPGGTEAYAVRRFTEKPSLAHARKYVASGSYDWNAGIFIWRAARVIKELDRHIPETARSIARAATAFRQRKRDAFARAFKVCQSISIDYAVMERARGLIVLPADIGWNDVGSWSALRNILPLDDNENLWILPRGGSAHAENARGLIVRSSKPLVAALGVSDLVVVETDDALLICRTESAQSVGQMIKTLRRKGFGKFL